MMKISGRHFFLVLVMVFIIAGCGRADENQVEPAATAAVEKTSMIQAPTQEPTAVITETVIVENRIVTEKCIDEIAELGEAEDISGSIVLYVHESSTIYHNLVLFTPETQEITEISPPYSEENEILLSNTSVSPDGEYLAYQTNYFVGYESVGNKINIINPENEKITEIDSLYPTTYFQWLNNDVLLIRTVQEKNPLILTEIPSGKQKYLYPTLGDEFYDSDFLRWWFFYGLHKNIYNSDLSRVVYPSHDESSPTIVMHNMENDSDILTVPTKNGFGASPVWSPDGNYFAIAIADKPNNKEEYINIFNRDGEVIFQTDATTTKMKETIYSMAWSPDSKLIAFVYNIKESSEYTYHLGIVDVEEEKITLYCSPEVYQYTQLYWSPDGRYLIYPSKSTDEDEMKSYVLDIETGQNYLVMDGYFPGGWMK